MKTPNLSRIAALSLVGAIIGTGIAIAVAILMAVYSLCASIIGVPATLVCLLSGLLIVGMAILLVMEENENHECK